MLVPVIGLVQVGEQSMADRYTYLPLIGLFIILVWGAGEACDRWRLPKGGVRRAPPGWCWSLAAVQTRHQRRPIGGTVETLSIAMTLP